MTRKHEQFEWTDERILEALHLKDNEGMTAKAVAERMGVTRNSVIGMIHRIKVAEVDGDAGDHSMPPRWWRRGR